MRMRDTIKKLEQEIAVLKADKEALRRVLRTYAFYEELFRRVKDGGVEPQAVNDFIAAVLWKGRSKQEVIE